MKAVLAMAMVMVAGAKELSKEPNGAGYHLGR